MKKILLILLISTLFIGCSSDSNSGTSADPITTGTKIKTIEKVSNGLVVLTTEYTYNAIGNIVTSKQNDGYKIYETTFSYNSSNVLTKWIDTETYIGDNPTNRVYSETNNLEYTGDKLTTSCIDRFESYFGTPNYYKDKIDFYYQANSPSSVQHYSPRNYYPGDAVTCSDVSNADNEETFEYTNGNMTFYDSGVDSFFNYYYKYEYDNKNHYQSNIKPDSFRVALGLSTKNNITKGYEYRRDNNQLNATITYENTYNTSDFPTKTIVKYFTVGSTSPSNTTEYRYTYY